MKTRFTGDIYSFSPDDWEPYDKELQKNDSIKVQYRVVDLETSSFCTSETKYTYFPDTYTLLGAINLCNRFGGKIVDLSSKEKIESVTAYMWGLQSDPEWTKPLYTNLAIYTMFTDKEQFNVWRDFETGKLPDDPLVWGFGEPNGADVENCADLQTISDKKGGWMGRFNDLSCAQPRPVACEGIGTIRLILRGKSYKGLSFSKPFLFWYHKLISCSRFVLKNSHG